MARPNHAKPREPEPHRRVWLIVVLLAAGLLAIPATAQDAPTTCDYSQSHLHNGWGWDKDSEESCAPAQGANVAASFAGPNLAGASHVEPAPVEHSHVESTPVDHTPVDSAPVEPAQVQPTAHEDVMADHPVAPTTTVAPLMVGTCDYSRSHHFNGYGWDETNGVSCKPLLTTSTTEYIAPEPGSPEDYCDYSKSHLFEGYGWDEINGISCEPMANRLAKAARRDDHQLAEDAIEQAVQEANVEQAVEEDPVDDATNDNSRPPAGSSPVHPDDWDGDGVVDPMDSFPFDPDRD